MYKPIIIKAMYKCAIFIETKNGNKILSVDNFSKENVQKAIEIQFNFPIFEVVQLTASMTGCICGMKNIQLFEQSEICGIGVLNSDFPKMFEVKYGTY